jgi:hypothetical protein
MMLAPVLTPRGLLILRPTEEALGLESEQNSRLEKAFLRGPGHGLLCLGAKWGRLFPQRCRTGESSDLAT